MAFLSENSGIKSTGYEAEEHCLVRGKGMSL